MRYMETRPAECTVGELKAEHYTNLTVWCIMHYVSLRRNLSYDDLTIIDWQKYSALSFPKRLEYRLGEVTDRKYNALPFIEQLALLACSKRIMFMSKSLPTGNLAKLHKSPNCDFSETKTSQTLPSEKTSQHMPCRSAVLMSWCSWINGWDHIRWKATLRPGALRKTWYSVAKHSCVLYLELTSSLDGL